MGDASLFYLCSCGCGREVKPGNTFLQGHGGHSLEARRKQSIAHKKRYENPEERAKKSLSLILVCNTEEVRKIKSEAAKKAFNRPEIRKKRSEIAKIVQNRPDIKKKMQAIQKIVQNRPEVKLKHSKTAKIINNKLDKRLAHSQFVKKWMRENKEFFLSRNNTIERREKFSTLQKANWRNSDYVKKQMKARNVAQNKKEKELDLLLHSLYPDEYRFVGDGKVVINGKCPDFINVNGQKKIIELFGDYWHEDKEVEERKDTFNPFGYETLVIWERELKDLEQLQQRIKEFHESRI